VLICPQCETVYPDGAAQRCSRDGTPLYVIGDDVGARKAMAAGDIVAGKYELIEELPRRGGAGRTFLARQVRLDRVVELRLLPENTITRPSDHARFLREVATWGRLHSDHLVRLYDSGFAEGNAPYMALEHVASGSAGDLLRAHGPLDIALCQKIALHMLSALEVAHEANVLHRDVTPEAIVLEERPDGRLHARLTGFGLAKHLGDAADDPTAITMTGQVVGNPAYMAPETILQGVLDPRTDLYALGVTVYELAAGRRPNEGDSLSAMLAAHVRGEMTPLEEVRFDVSAEFRGFVHGLLARDPLTRFQSAEEAREALERDAASSPAGVSGIPDFRPMLAKKRRRTPGWVRSLWQALVLGALGAGAALVWKWLC
jgi:serine/threonine protein kinase